VGFRRADKRVRKCEWVVMVKEMAEMNRLSLYKSVYILLLPFHSNQRKFGYPAAQILTCGRK
jgi:hypothetical protein